MKYTNKTQNRIDYYSTNLFELLNNRSYNSIDNIHLFAFLNDKKLKGELYTNVRHVMSCKCLEIEHYKDYVLLLLNDNNRYIVSRKNKVYKLISK